MIDFELDETLQGVRDILHWFSKEEVRPLALAADRAHAFPDDFLRKVKEMGISTGALSHKQDEEKRHKGPKTANRVAAIASEELAWGDAAFMLCIPGPGLGGPPIQFLGTPEQKERFFGVFTKDKEPRFGAYGLTEPGAGSDVAGIRTTCRRDGDDWVLDGAKCFITNGGRAEWVVIFATSDASRGREAPPAFVVEKGTPGFRVGKIEKKMGLRASETAELILENCRVPSANLLGARDDGGAGEGFMGAMKTFDTTRPMVAAMAVGIGRAAIERPISSRPPRASSRSRACSPGAPRGWPTKVCPTRARLRCARPTRPRPRWRRAPPPSPPWARPAARAIRWWRSGFATSRCSTSSRAPVRSSAS